MAPNKKRLQEAWARHDEILKFVEEHPKMLLKDVQELFGVSKGTMRRALKGSGINGKDRYAFRFRRFGDKRITDYTWLHVGDRIMEVSGKSKGRIFELDRVIYRTDLSVGYRYHTVSSFREGRTSTISHSTLTNGKYIRIHTGERTLPAERFMAWTFGPSTPSPGPSRPSSSPETTPLTSRSGSRTA